MRGGSGIDLCRRRIVAGALGAAVWPELALAQGKDAARNREIYLYRGADREKRIIEGAKKEREVVVYTSLNLKDSVPIVEVFERKYGVKVRLWRSSSEKVLQRAVAEARAGRFSCDILETNGPEMEAMHREELLEEFFSPNFKDLLLKGQKIQKETE
jgi:iron(III) transport system substrate-binding protein